MRGHIEVRYGIALPVVTWGYGLLRQGFGEYAARIHKTGHMASITYRDDSMHLKLLRAAAAVAVLGGTATLGLGTQAAMATTTTVDCNTADLVTAMTSYTTGDTLVL